MLHELLLALHGIPGGLFYETKNASVYNEYILDTSLIPVVENLPFVPAGELALQTDLLKLGNYYKFLQNFIQRFGSSYQGLYLSSIAFGIDNALKDYRLCLSSLEMEVLADPTLGVSHLSYRLHSYKILLPVLTKVVIKVQKAICINDCGQSDSNCRLLDVIMSSAPIGLPNPQIVIGTLLNHVMQVFYRQLSSWLIYGVLHDPHREFFIEVANPEKETESNDSSLSNCINQFFNFSLSKQSVNPQIIHIVNHDRIPVFLPPSFAQRVLITGKAVYMASSDFSKSSILFDLEKLYSPRFKKLANSTDALINEKESYDLIDTNNLYNLVCDIQHFVSHRAWVVILEEHKLLQHLHLVKDVLLLGRGELFLTFLDQLSLLNTYSDLSQSESRRFYGPNILDKVLPANADELRTLEYDVTEAFLGAARSIGIDDEKLDALFKFSISKITPDCSNSIHSDEISIWDCLNLQFVVPPGLEFIFTPQICKAYSRLFRFLFNIRRTQLQLQQFWADQTLSWRQSCAPKLFSIYAGRNTNLSPDTFAELQCTIDRRLLVRNYMAFIVENFQYYLQVDVIDSQFAHLIDRIGQDQEIELIQVAHEACLASLQAQALLFYPNVELCIVNLLRVCRKFVLLAAYQSSLPLGQCFQLSDQEESLVREFEQYAANLFQILNSSCSTGAKSYVSFKSSPNWKTNKSSSTDMSQLLLRLDFNRFYSNTAENILKT